MVTTDGPRGPCFQAILATFGRGPLPPYHKATMRPRNGNAMRPILPSKPSNTADGKALTWRDKKSTAFIAEWCAKTRDAEFTLHLYRPVTRGVYGPQFRAVLFVIPQKRGDVNGPWQGALTSGCGYNKINAAVASCLLAAGYPSKGGADPLRQLVQATGVPANRWRHAQM